jgi:hypothetical protein
LGRAKCARNGRRLSRAHLGHGHIVTIYAEDPTGPVRL